MNLGSLYLYINFKLQIYRWQDLRKTEEFVNLQK